MCIPAVVIRRTVHRVRDAAVQQHHIVHGATVHAAILAVAAAMVLVAAGGPVAAGVPVAAGGPVAAMVPVPTLADAAWPVLRVHVQSQQRRQNHTAVQLDTI